MSYSLSIQLAIFLDLSLECVQLYKHLSSHISARCGAKDIVDICEKDLSYLEGSCM
ncbi:hypothetical protein PGTUg99_031893 [Puccinia graminis f. sp. tritici]|uniref:Uncharacterized protein n=1 Tax=Puccinia graminis f. sp. tritici TaxID=56615 RepID=A0A5B0SLC0_PUCGR|nr:hypothetical protein PGTUg99_031893 [Puccinia graminis f. sp. tritici]